MRILHVIAGSTAGGAENIMLESVLSLQELPEIEQCVVTRANNRFRLQAFKDGGIQTHTASFNRFCRFSTSATIRRAIKIFNPDVLEYWMGRAGQFSRVSHRDRSIGWYGGYYKLARFKNCAWHVGLTQDLCRHIEEQGVYRDRIGLIHTMADFKGTKPVDRASLDTPETVPVALSLSRLHWKKGLDTLLEATAKVPGLYVWMAGNGPIEAELKAHARRLGLDDRVRFLGWRNDRSALLASCDMVTFPSRYEPFGSVTVDAWAAGKPLIAANAAGPAAYVKDGENGLLIPGNNVDALAGAIDRVVHEKGLAKKLVAGGKASYEAQFTKAAFQKDSLAFYNKILGSN